MAFISKSLTACVLLPSMSLGAVAADLPSPRDLRPALGEPSAAQVVDWTGASVGTFGEGLFSTADVGASGVGQIEGFGLRGPGLGASVGYDVEFGSGLVAGFEADARFSASSGTLSSGSAQVKIDDRAAWSLRGRVGEAVGATTLLYGTAGVTEMLGEATANGLGVLGGFQRAYLPGLALGFGAETRLTGDIFTRLEFLHSTYVRTTYLDGELGVRPTTDAVRLSLVWRPDAIARAGAPSDKAAKPTDWTGGYVGGTAGWESASLGLGGPAGGRFAALSAWGPSGALLAGYNVLLRDVVAGGEIEAGASAATAKMTSSGRVLNGSLGGEGALRLRFGSLLTPDTLIYETAGLSFADMSWSGSSGPFAVSGSKAFSGMQFGIGLETALTEHIAGRLEYLYSVYAAQSDVSPRMGMSRTGIVYKF